MAAQTQTKTSSEDRKLESSMYETVPDFDVTEDFIRKGMDQIDVNTLRLALYQITHDKELESMKVARIDFRGGAAVDYFLLEDDQKKVHQKAFQYLRFGSQQIPPPPSREERLEELAFDELPRDINWTSRTPPRTIANWKVVVIGAGISGIAAAVYLKQLRIPFKVIERQDGIGGTWLLNSYLHVRVDSPFSAFQYNFVKDYKWDEFFPAGGKIREYLEYVAAKYGIIECTKFNRRVIGAQWNERTSKWDLEIKHKDGSLEKQEINIVISASGLFSTPNLPGIFGIKSFKGPIFHTSHYDHSVDIKGKWIVLIETGSSGTQSAPALGRDSNHLTVINAQRTGSSPLHSCRF